MACDEKLAERIRKYLLANSVHTIEEKKMFRGLTFMIQGKMCVGVSGNELMLRFDPNLHEEFGKLNCFRPMLSKNKAYKGYGYIQASGIKTDQQLYYWLNIALQFNKKVKVSRRK